MPFGPASTKRRQEQFEVSQLLKQFSKDATIFVNIPTLILNASIVLLTLYLDQTIRFRGTVDWHLHHYEAKDAIPRETFSLFLHGVETGAIVCTIVFSQLIYLIIKTRLEWRIRSLASGFADPLPAGSPKCWMKAAADASRSAPLTSPQSDPPPE